MKDIKINISTYELHNGQKAKIAVIMYGGTDDPRSILDDAVRIFVREKPYHELIDANLDNPWMRVILENINDMEQKNFDPQNDHL